MEIKNKFGIFFTLLAQIPGADKEELIWAYSNMLTTSLREFHDKNPDGYLAMIRDMQKLADNKPTYKQTEQDVKLWRSAILKRLQKAGIDTTNWQAVNSFLLNPKIVGKPLYKLEVDEMKSLLPKLESIIYKETVKLLEINRLMQCN